MGMFMLLFFGTLIIIGIISDLMSKISAKEKSSDETGDAIDNVDDKIVHANSYSSISPISDTDISYQSCDSSDSSDSSSCD